MKKVMVTGGEGFLGYHVCKLLKEKDYDTWSPSHQNYDLRNFHDVANSLEIRGIPDIVIHLAAVAGGIGLNREQPAKLFYDNLMMGTLMMHYANEFKVKKYVSLGTVCSYPKFTPVPFKEENIWNGYPETTNCAYALAKKMALVQAQAYRQQYGFNAIYLIPVNMYGPMDNFDPEHSHVIPGMIEKIVNAKQNNLLEVVLWGTGLATREFLYVEDCAEAIVAAMEQYDGPEPVNIGTGKSISIHDLAYLIAKIVDYKGNFVWDNSKPDGQPARQLDVSRAKKYFGFEAKTDLASGLKKTIEWYMNGENITKKHIK